MVSRRNFSRRALLRGGLYAGIAVLGMLIGSRPAGAYRSRWGRWECQNDQCEPYVYDPVAGIPDFDIPPGIPFEDLPDDWVCPVCGDSKRQFQSLA